MSPEDCLFCKISEGKIPSHKLYEDERTFAFLDIGPVSPGHTLVIPKTHAEDLSTIRKEDLAAVMETVRTLAPKIERAVSADGFNIHINNRSAAGQIIFHSHVHIIPRFANDDLSMWKHKEGIDLTTVAEKVKAEI
jgi:histidine triad (HIT) family protein